jgi:hypothetical protein
MCADGDLAPPLHACKKGAFRRHGPARGFVIKGSHLLPHTHISIAKFHSQRSLADGREHLLKRKNLANVLSHAQSQDARIGKEHPCPGGFLEFLEAGLQISTDVHNGEVGAGV